MDRVGQSGTEWDRVVQKDLKGPKKGHKGPFSKVCPGLSRSVQVCPSLCHSVSLRQCTLQYLEQCQTELNRVRQSEINNVGLFPLCPALCHWD